MGSKRPKKVSKRAFAPPAEASKQRFSFYSPALVGVLLAALTAAVYSQVLHFPFTNFDDPGYVSLNRNAQAGLRWSTVQWAFTTTEQANWHPLTWLSHAADCQWFGLNASGHHATSLILHILNAVALFGLLWGATAKLGRSAFVAALFAIHPLNVESVAWIAERKNVLSMLLFLLALGAYGWYVRRPSIVRYCGVATLFALSLAAKPMGITLPFVLLLLDYWPLERFKRVAWPRLALEKAPLLVLSCASALITVKVQSAGHTVASAAKFSLATRLGNALISYAAYLRKTVWPLDLAIPYPHPGNEIAFWKPATAFVLLAAISYLAWRTRRERPYIAMGWMCFLGTMVPVIGLIQVGDQAMADRYAYLPLIGVFVAVVWGISDFAAERLDATEGRNVGFQPVLATAVLVLLCVATWTQIGYWRDSYVLWEHTLAVTEDNYMAEDQMGVTLVDAGRKQEALPHFQKAVRLNSWDALGHLNLGALIADQGHLRESIPDYEAAAQLDPGDALAPLAYSDLGNIYRELGDYPRARASYQEALRRRPDLESAFAGLGMLETYEAIGRLATSVGEHPSAEGYFQLGQLQQQVGRLQDARAAYSKVLRLDPTMDAARQALSAIEGR